MATRYLLFVILLPYLTYLSIAFITDGPTKLPQYNHYGQSLVLVGGNLEENNTEIYNAIVEMAGGRGVAKIGIIYAASADPNESYHYYHDMFMNYGALEANRIPIDVNHTSANSDPSVIAIIKKQTGFFFGGGDQMRVTQSFLLSYGRASPALVAIKSQMALGAVVAGTSAGTTCQTVNLMMASGVSWDALRYGARDKEDPKHPDDLVYNKYGGIGMLDGYVIDTHFSQKGREGRMIRLLSDTRKMLFEKDYGFGIRRVRLGSDYAFGVDENTALVVTHAESDDIQGKVVGPGGVTFFDLSKATHEPNTTYFNIRDVYLTYLTNGDLINLKTRAVNFSSAKTSMAGHEGYRHALTSHDIFHGSRAGSSRKAEFVRVATSIFDARLDRTSYGTTYESNPRFRVTMSRAGRSAEGWVERKHSFHSDITSYKDLYVEITEN